jgi:stage V sporulation protein D (sporulation-specific penicillin-binding protein)
MGRTKTYHRKKCLFLLGFFLVLLMVLAGRIGYLMLFQSEHYSQLATDLHQRERSIKAARGIIYDRNGVKLASNKQVCTISVIHSQVTDPDEVISLLAEKLELSTEEVQKKVEKVSSREKIKSNVPKETADEIREAHLDGVKVDEDYKRYYPFDDLASKVLGFCGSDNQGIVGLEVTYEDILAGTAGKILTLTDYKGIEIENAAEERVDPVDGKSLYLSIDVNIQKYAEQAAKKAMKKKEALSVSIILMNPQNGEIYAMVDLPEYNLNDPFTLTDEILEKLARTASSEETDTTAQSESTQEQLNQMWRNSCTNDTYEPGSTFKVITATAGLSEGVVSLSDQFSCPGYRIVEDRKIRCHKTG